MKNFTLLLLSSLMLSLSANAQTSSDNSGNVPAPSEFGYMFDFKGTTADNCPAKIPYDQWAQHSAYTMNSIGNDTMVVSTDGTQEGWHRIILKFSEGNCSDLNLDLTGQTYLSMIVRAEVATPQCLIQVYDAGANAITNPSWAPLTVGVNTLTFNNLDLTGIDATQVKAIGLTFRKSWDDNAGGAVPSVIGKFHIAEIRIGDQTGIVTDVAKTDISSDLNAFPNPSTGTLNVSLANGGNSTVSLSDLTGNVVIATSLSENSTSINTTGLPKGMYILKAENNNQVGYKKIIVQ